MAMKNVGGTLDAKQRLCRIVTTVDYRQAGISSIIFEGDAQEEALKSRRSIDPSSTSDRHK